MKSNKNWNTILVLLLGIILFVSIYSWRTRNLDIQFRCKKMDRNVHNSRAILNDFALVQQYNQILSTDSLKMQMINNINGESLSF